MKKIALLALVVVSQLSVAQIRLDSYFESQVIDKYKQYDNYTVEIITQSTIRGDRYRDIDSVFIKNDTTIVYIEKLGSPSSFTGVQTAYSIAYTTNDTNITIEFLRKFITINSLTSNEGEYFNHVYVSNAGDFSGGSSFASSIINGRKRFKKIDKISDIHDYIIFEYVDSNVTVNDIKMYEDVALFVNKETSLLEKITTKRRNNTLAELGLGAIERIITLNYLEFDQPNSIYKMRFDTVSYHYLETYKNESPYSRRLDIRKKQDAQFEQSQIKLDRRILKCPLVDFEGKEFRLNEIDGWLLFDTWNAGCYPCFEMMKEVSQNQSEFTKRNIRIVSLNTWEEPSEYLKAFCEKQRVDISNLYFFKSANDVQLFKKSLKIFPSIFLISPDKKVVWHTNGRKSTTELLQKIDEYINK